MKRVIETEDFKVEFEDTPELRDAVFEKVLDFFEKHEAFQGESIMQNDDPVIFAPEMLADVADDLFKFKVDWK